MNKAITPEMAESSATPSPAKGRWLRFSLRTLVLLVLLIASGATLWWNSAELWRKAYTIDEPGEIYPVRFSDDDRYVLLHYMGTDERGEHLRNCVDVRRADSGDRHVLIEAVRSRYFNAAGPYVMLFAWNDYISKGSAYSLHNWLEKRELQCGDKFVLNGEPMKEFSLRPQRILMRFESKTIVCRLPGFEVEWESENKTVGDGASFYGPDELWIYKEPRQELHNLVTKQVVVSPPITGSYRWHDGNMIHSFSPASSKVYNLRSGSELSVAGEVYEVSGERMIVTRDGEDQLIDLTDNRVLRTFSKSAEFLRFGGDKLILDVLHGQVYDAVDGKGLWKVPGEDPDVDFLNGGSFIRQYARNSIVIYEARTGRVLMDFSSARYPNENHAGRMNSWDHRGLNFVAHWDGPEFESKNPDAEERKRASVWRLRRPWQWWGLAWMPEFWVTVVLALGMVWSLLRDRRIGKGP